MLPAEEGGVMGTYQIRIPVQVRDESDKRKPRVWRDHHVRVKIDAEDPESAVQILQNRLSSMVDRGFSFSIEVESAPGDLCDNTKVLTDGSPCPGCRACA